VNEERVGSKREEKMLQYGVKGVSYFTSVYIINLIVRMLFNRYFAVTDTKLIYYTGMDRSSMKGEIVLAGVRLYFLFDKY
jgi:hypothetical protein